MGRKFGPLGPCFPLGCGLVAHTQSLVRLFLFCYFFFFRGTTAGKEPAYLYLYWSLYVTDIYTLIKKKLHIRILERRVDGEKSHIKG